MTSTQADDFFICFEKEMERQKAGEIY